MTKIRRQPEKSTVFTSRVIFPEKRPERAGSAQEALLIALNERGRIDFDRMTQLTGKSARELQHDLANVIFRNPASGWEASDQYLSGNVREKLVIAESAAKADSFYQRNVDALKEVQPRDLECTAIYANLGATWIPASDIVDFVLYLLEAKRGVSVAYADAIGTWVVKIDHYEGRDLSNRVQNTKTWGTSRYSAIDLIESALNQRIPKVIGSSFRR